MERVEMKRGADGRIYSMRTKLDNPSSAQAALGATLAYVAGLCFLYGILSFNRPEVMQAAFENKLALFALLFGAGVVFVSFTVRLSILGSATFEKVTSRNSKVRISRSINNIGSWILKATTGLELAVVDEPEAKKDKPVERNEAREESFSYGASGEETSFERYMSKVLKSLSTYAETSEVTASKLLDKGVAFMAGGIIFYVVAIVIWQLFKNLLSPDEHVMYVGMAACSMTFIVIEFLAAWFFKQYRYYVEVSLACLRVRSVYDRYLLGYYAVREFDLDGKNGSCDKVVTMLKEDVNWPAAKSAIDTDFNYMLESMGTAHTSIEKLKGLFQRDSTKPVVQN